MANTVITGPILDSFGQPANGYLYGAQTARSAIDGALVTQLVVKSRVVDGTPFLDDGITPLEVPATAVDTEAFEWVEDLRPYLKQVVRHTIIPAAGPVAYADLQEVKKPAESSTWIVPGWARELVDANAGIAGSVAHVDQVKTEIDTTIDGFGDTVTEAQAAIDAAAAEVESFAGTNNQQVAAMATTPGPLNDVLNSSYVTVNEDGDLEQGGVVIPINASSPSLPPLSVNALPRMANPPTLSLTQTAAASAGLVSPVVYGYNDPAMAFTGNGPTAPDGTYGGSTVGDGTASYFEWGSDAPLLDLRLVNSNSLYTLFIDGEMVEPADLATPISTGSTDAYRLTVDFAGVSKPRRFRLYATRNMRFGGIRIAGRYNIWKVPYLKPFGVVMGDSYSEGNGAVPSSETQSTVLMHNLGVDCLVDGIGGAGWTNSTAGDPAARIAAKIATLTRVPSVFIFALGYNNGTASDPNVIKPYMTAAFAALRAINPTMQIICMGPATPQGDTAGLTAIAAAIKSRAQAESVWFVPSNGIVTPLNKDVFTGPDAVHPTPAGHVRYGERWAMAVRAILGLPNPTAIPESAPAHDPGVTGVDHRYIASRLGAADGAAIPSWPDEVAGGSPLVDPGGTAGTVTFVADAQGGLVRLTSTSGNSQIRSTASAVTKPRTAVVVVSGANGGNLIRSAGVTINRDNTAKAQATATGTGSGGQILVGATMATWAVIIIAVDSGSAVMYVNGAKVTAPTWVAGADYQLQLIATSARNTDVRELFTVPRLVTDTEAASILAAMKAKYTDLP